MLSDSTNQLLVSDDASFDYVNAIPFSHCVIDNFFEEVIANEFPIYDETLDAYFNQIEEKNLVNYWNRFGLSAYQAFNYLCSSHFTQQLTNFTKLQSNLSADIGLHGGGIHMHKSGGKLNVHLDYSIHPKLKLQRKINLLVYMSPDWKLDYGGYLGLYDNSSQKKPGELVEAIAPLFDCAVIFDVTMNSWHGLPVPISCPEGVSRNSLALYYLQKPDQSADQDRKKALFAQAPWQESDESVLELIRRIPQISSAASTYFS